MALVEEVFTDASHHPARRRVKFLPARKFRAADGMEIDVNVDSTLQRDMPILWSRPVEGGTAVECLLLVSDEPVQTMLATVPVRVFLVLPETSVLW